MEEVEVQLLSLKDSVWRLTTRVCVLEDFIYKKFGKDAVVKIRKSTTRGRKHSSNKDISEEDEHTINFSKHNEIPNSSEKKANVGLQKRYLSSVEQQLPSHDDTSSESSDFSDESHHEKKRKRASRGRTQHTGYYEELPGSDIDTEKLNTTRVKDSDFEYDPSIIPKIEPCSDNRCSDLEAVEIESTESLNHNDRICTPNKSNTGKTARRGKRNFQNSKDNLPPSSIGLSFVQSQRGQEKLVFNGYIYTKTNTSKGTTYWRCEKHHKCDARGVYTKKGFKVTRNHIHDADKVRLELALLRSKIREMSSTDNLPSEILQNVMDGASETAVNCVNKESWTRNIRYYQQKNLNQLTHRKQKKIEKEIIVENPNIAQ